MSLKRVLAEKILEHEKEIRAWYQRHVEKAPPPFYCSVDLRDSGYKIAPVDSNLYPAGFNNICPVDQQAASGIFKNQIERSAGRLKIPTPKKVLILPESHTQNRYYIENLYSLQEILRLAGFEVEIGWMPGTEIVEPEISLVSVSGKELKARPIEIHDGILRAGGFTPDLVLLNNDFSSGYPTLLDDVKQPILPSHRLGWHSRKKSEHFLHYNELAAEFATLIGVDPWILQIDTDAVDEVNFNEEIGTQTVAQVVEQKIGRMRTEFEKRGIAKKPFVFVKNNSGTYGMGIMVVHSSDEVRTMNRRTKNKMSVGKNKRQIESVVVQEGVPTSATIENVTAEPVIYLAGCELLGGFLRVNSKRSNEDNLNSEGMVFRKLCVSDLRDFSHSGFNFEDSDPEDLLTRHPVLELVYGSIARISALAAGRELACPKVERTQPFISQITTVTSSA